MGEQIIYDVIIIGGGHAGIEAANSASKIAKNVLLITLSLQKIGLAPCNPSIGGSAKGIVVREISALGGLMGKIADESTLQIKVLNKSKGPAVQSLRAQIDKLTYPRIALKMLQKIKNLTIIEGQVLNFIIKKNKVLGVECVEYGQIKAQTVVITTGTYMNSLIYQGKNIVSSASDNQKTTVMLSNNLRKYGIDLVRFRTGTPPRLDGTTINYSKCLKMRGSDDTNLRFGFSKKRSHHMNIPCWLTHTTSKTHKYIRKNLCKSVIHSQENIGKGPRYCPSIEDKIVRFAEKKRHQLFLEPESLYTDSIYLQGFSNSLPKFNQKAAIQTITGLENVRIFKFGYTIEYDAIKPTEITQILELRKIKNLFSAGQINCTSGYEEAAGQGLVAGVNAALRAIKSTKKFILNRNEAYIGVMISDLVTKEINEPYRLLTALAEFRLLLRGGNAEFRLVKKANKFNLISPKMNNLIQQKQKDITELVKKIKFTTTRDKNQEINKWLVEKYLQPLNNIMSLAKLLRRPEISIFDILRFIKSKKTYSEDVYYETEVRIKYEYYLKLQAKQIKQMENNARFKLPPNLNYFKIAGISKESQEKLQERQPANISQLLLIGGIRFDDVMRIKLYLKFISQRKVN